MRARHNRIHDVYFYHILRAIAMLNNHRGRLVNSKGGLAMT
jgi:hypothetical protein